MSDLRVVLADDNVFIRAGVRSILDELPGFVAVAECGDADELRAAVAEHEPDIVVTDIQMPPTMSNEGIAAALEFRRTRPDMGVLVLSQYIEPEYALVLFEEGAAGLGYLLKERVADVDELERALRAVARGESAIDPSVVDVLVVAGSKRSSDLARLTPRENDVLGLIAEGFNNGAIAERLVLGDKAVAKHINGIFSKLGLAAEPDVHRRVKAVLLWLAG